MLDYRFLGTLAVVMLSAAPVQAQILSDRVVGDQRICSYVGSDQLPDGQTVPRTEVIPAGQPCPAIAPYRDPNRPVPGNAMLTGERTEADRRICNYSQGGTNYSRSIAITQNCAMTPDLLDRQSVRNSNTTTRSGY
jgi:hypothetical protein